MQYPYDARSRPGTPPRGGSAQLRAPPPVQPLPLGRLPDRCPLLTGLPSASSHRLLATARVRRHRAGGVLALSGAYPGGCWLLLEGHVKEHRRLRDGSEVITDVRGPGDLVGEASALDRAPSPVDASTVDSVLALFLDATRLSRLASADEAIAAALQHAVSLRALSAQRLAVRNGRQDLEHRVIAALLELSDRFGVDVPTGRCLGVPLSQAELGAWAGMSRESCSKVLRRLRTSNLVITSRRDIVLPDVVALRTRLQTPRLVPQRSSRGAVAMSAP